MRVLLITVAAAGLLAGCSGEPAPETKVEETAAALTPGEYELVAKVDELRSTDKTTPASSAKVGGDPVTTRTCVGPENKIDVAAFVEAGETCTASDSYMRNGRISLQYKCSRPGKGELTHLVDGDFKADSFAATVRTATYYPGDGDYELVRSFTGKRVGECSAKAG